MEDSRYQREAEFHNKAFSEGFRNKISKYYELIDSSRTCYRDYLAKECKDRSVLEYGCGQNSLARFLGASGAAKVTGIDISEVAVRDAEAVAARAGCTIATYRVMNAETLEFPDQTFDLICGVAILHHLDVQKALSEIARTLKPGGSAIFKEPLAHNPLFNLYRRFTPSLRTDDEHPLTMGEVGMANRYFESVDVQYFHLFVFLAAPFSRFGIFTRLMQVLEPVDRWLFRSFPFMRKFAWTAVICLSRPRSAAVRSRETEPAIKIAAFEE